MQGIPLPGSKGNGGFLLPKSLCHGSKRVGLGLAFPFRSLFFPPFCRWCSGRDSNPYALRHTPLKRVCLPIPPPEQLSKEEGGLRGMAESLSSPEVKIPGSFLKPDPCSRGR